MHKIHPFDLYILRRDNPNSGLPESTWEGDTFSFDGEVYMVTTTVEPVTKEIY